MIAAVACITLAWPGWPAAATLPPQAPPLRLPSQAPAIKASVVALDPLPKVSTPKIVIPEVPQRRPQPVVVPPVPRVTYAPAVIEECDT